MENNPTQLETLRLQALDSYNILDTNPEQAFDDITQIAAQICDTDISLVSFVADSRQWFKSRVGLDATETPIEVSFCKHAIDATDDLFVVRDARIDNRFRNNLLVTHAPFIVFYAAVPLVNKEGFKLGTLCVIDDTPKILDEYQKNSLKALARQVVNLLELRRNNILLEEYNDILIQKNRELEQITYLSSHDLQEPLHTLINFSKLFKNRYDNNLGSDGKKYLDLITSSSIRMKDMLDALLEYSVIGSSPKKDWLDLNIVLVDVLENLADAIEANNAKINYPTLPTIKGNKKEINILFYHLISNAIKFTKEKTSPRVDISFLEENTYWQFSIKDKGIGVPSTQQKKIFQIFQRLHHRDSYTGYGVGLAYCQKIITSNKGKIWIDSEEGLGCTIHFTLPK